MSGTVQGISKTQTGPLGRRWLKKVMRRLERREAKRINDPDTDTNPKRRYIGWD